MKFIWGWCVLESVTLCEHTNPQAVTVKLLFLPGDMCWRLTTPLSYHRCQDSFSWCFLFLKLILYIIQIFQSGSLDPLYADRAWHPLQKWKPFCFNSIRTIPKPPSLHQWGLLDLCFHRWTSANNTKNTFILVVKSEWLRMQFLSPPLLSTFCKYGSCILSVAKD